MSKEEQQQSCVNLMKQDLSLPTITKTLGKEAQIELMKIYQLDFIISIIKYANPKLIVEIEENQIRKIQRSLIISSNYNASNMIIEELQKPTLLYTEIQALLKYIFGKIHEQCIPALELIERIKNDLPGVIENPYKSPIFEEIIKLEKKRQDICIKLLKSRSKLIKLFETAVELKLSPQLSNELILLKEEHSKRILEVNIFKSIIAKQFFTQTDHTITAIKKIEANIDKLIEEGDN